MTRTPPTRHKFVSGELVQLFSRPVIVTAHDLLDHFLGVGLGVVALAAASRDDLSG